MKKNFELRINNKIISNKKPVFIIAEAGSNHNGDLKMAKKLIDVAKNAGADCVKFQTYTAETFCVDKKKKFTYLSQGKKITESEFSLFKRLEFNKKQWKSLIDYCKYKKIIFMTTIQDPENLTMMKSIGLNSIKIGSDDFDHLENLKYYCESKLPLILSKGMSDLKELNKTINFLKKNYSKIPAILHCVSIYPSQAKDLNLKHISYLRKKYKNIIWGFSDHSQSIIAPSIAVAYGAKIIEKHFTLEKNLAGPDHWFSMNPKELKEMIKHIRFTEQSIGSSNYKISKKELFSKSIMRRKIVAKHDINKNEKIKMDDIIFKRSETGEKIENLKKILGKITNKKISKHSGLSLKDLKK
jgi:N,N'-diacetyllegionaminate synthase